jgi:hypothetical protein
MMLNRRTAKLSILVAVVAMSLAASAMPVLAMPDAVRLLVGSWGGSGRIYYNDGTSEGIKCAAYYTGHDRELTLAIQCRSEKNPIHIRSKLRLSGGRVSGKWEERTFNASGTASGTIGDSSFQLSISGGGFTGKMAASVRNSSHRVTISTQGIAMSRATMDFTRR